MNTQDIINKLVEYGVPHDDAITLAAVGYAESGYIPNSYGDRSLGGSIGLFQIHLPAHWDKLTKWTGSQEREDWIDWLENPVNNIKAAAAVYKSQGLGAWTMYNNGGYKSYLGKDLSVQGLAEGVGTLEDPVIKGGEINSRPANTWYENAWQYVQDKIGLGQQPGDVPIKDEITARKAVGLDTADLEAAYKNSPKGGGLVQTVKEDISNLDVKGLIVNSLIVLVGLAGLVLGLFLITRKEG